MRHVTLLGSCLISLGLLSAPAIAQQRFFQDPVGEPILKAPITQDLNTYRLFQQDINAIQQYVHNTYTTYRKPGFSTRITLPLLTGGTATFTLSNSQTQSSALLDEHPETLAFKGISADGKHTVRLTLSPLGMMGSIRTAGVPGTVYFAPADLNQPEQLIIYSSTDLQEHVAHARCGADDTEFTANMNLRTLTAYLGSTQLRTYRLAVAATGEYTTWATSQTNALALITNSVNNINAIYETDCTVHFTLVTNNSVIYPDPNTDPYTTVSFPSSTTLTENNNALNANIGSANYDVGVVFGYGWSGGLANLNATCTSNKGKGSGGLSSGFSSGSSGPIFDNMIAHEIGHQFSATHTMSANNGSCSGNVTGASGWEPGGGSTIMAYAGSCSGNAYQSNSDNYFHGGTLAQIATFVTSGNGSICPALSTTGNTAPVITLSNNTYNIPAGTPFKLDMTVNDANPTDALSYTWEQMDAIGGSGTSSTPSATATSGPLFRSYPPSTQTERYFPSLSVLNGNASGTYEVLPTVVRSMHFRGTARDNHSDAGAAAYGDVTVNTLSCGPFAFTNMNSSSTLVANGSNTMTLTWDPATACIAMPNIQILFSTDGGQTFPYTILNSTPNDGSETITVPNLPTCAGRFMIAAIDNIYFNVNAADLTISSSCLANGTQMGPDSAVSASPGSTELSLNLAPEYGSSLSSPLTGSITSASPAGNLAFYNQNTSSCAGPSNANHYETITFYPSVSGTYTFTLTTGGYMVMNLYEGSFSNSSVCSNFMASSAYIASGGSGVTLTNNVSASLCANLPYVLVIETFGDVYVTLPYNYSITVGTPGGGSLSNGSPAPSGYNYVYSIVDNSSNTVVEISNVADLSDSATYTVGSYTVYGISTSSTAATLNSTYSGGSFNTLNSDLLNQSGGVCGQLSMNAVPVTVTAPLPVSLLNFSAHKTAAAMALLHWTVQEDPMTATYTLMRSEDGHTFTDLVTINAQGQQAYQYTDEAFAQMSGKIYYRLRIQDKDMQVQYSNIVFLQGNTGQNDIRLYPNPVTESVHIAFEHPYAADYHIAIINPIGQTIWQQDYQKPTQYTTVNVPAEDLSAGIYYIRIHSGTQTNTLKFVKE